MRLDELHNDLQSCILSLLDPVDILFLRKTCRTYHHITSQRAVWIDALQRVCFRNSIFMPTFPVQDMSLLHLEYAAMGPEMWCRFCNTDSGAARSKKPRAVRSVKASVLVHEVFLVPGGRYLVMTSDTQLSVWDLGVPWSLNSTHAIEKPIATERIAQRYGLLVHSTSDGKGLIIFIGLNGTRAMDTSVLFVIYPAVQHPRLLKIEMTVPPVINFLTAYSGMSPNKMVFLLDESLSVIDYRRGARASINIDQGYEQVLFTESIVLVAYPQRILVWPIPLFASASTPVLVPPPYDVPIPFQSHEIKACRCICDWYSGTHQKLLFDFFTEHRILRFEVVPGENFGAITVTQLAEFPRGRHPVPDLGRICNDTLVIWKWNNINCFMARMTSIPSSLSSERLDHTIYLDISTTLSRGYLPSSLCPSSGRFVHVDMGLVTISDYLSAPLSSVASPLTDN